MSRIKNIIGKRYGRLLVLYPLNKRYRGGVIWLCHCSCGNTTRVASSSLITGNTKSCGCLHRQVTSVTGRVTGKRAGEWTTTHGHAHALKGKKSRTYITWDAMKQRCLNPNRKDYPYYGARGITITPRWIDSFENFLDDLGERPEGMTLDRIDNEGNYEPGNVRWSTPKEQANNKRKYKKWNRLYG